MRSHSWQRAARAARADTAASRGIEFAATLLLFVLLGLFLDARLGTEPWWTVGLSVFAMAGGIASAYYRYEASMSRDDEGRVWSRRRERPAFSTRPLPGARGYRR